MSRPAARQTIDVNANSQKDISSFENSQKLSPPNRDANMSPMKRARRPFWENVDRSGGPDACWPWLGYCKKSGHGLTSHKGACMHASRKAYILTHGEIRSELLVCHKCDNAICCNAAHLYLGTRADNMIDRFGTMPVGERRPYNRSTVLSNEQLGELWEMRRKGKLLRECAAHFDVHIATICRYITIYRKEMLAKNRADRKTRVSRAGITSGD